jgi:hypothetical protein
MGATGQAQRACPWDVIIKEKDVFEQIELPDFLPEAYYMIEDCVMVLNSPVPRASLSGFAHATQVGLLSIPATRPLYCHW